jgi:glycosyltransferase involved in cell wall biosynthesis
MEHSPRHPQQITEIMGSKKILILSHKPPYPKSDGGCVAIAQVLESLEDMGHELTLLTMETHKHASDSINYPKSLKRNSVFVDTQIGFFPAFKNLFEKQSYILSRFKHSNYADVLKNVLQTNTFDCIIFESLFTSPYLKTVLKYSKANLLYRSHNIEHQIWENKSRFSSNPVKKKYLRWQAQRLRSEEINFWTSVPNIASISSQDAIEMTKFTKSNVKTMPLYADEKLLQMNVHVNHVDFFHLGAMDWMPNQQAISWLLNSVWPAVKEIEPQAELHLAGRGMSRQMASQKQNGLHVYGKVSDALQFMSEHQVMLVPLFVGSGMRVKIIEGMAMAKCIITTNTGIQGISCVHMENILIANTKEEFINMMIFCLNNPNEVMRIGQNAKHFVADNFSHEHVKQQLSIFLA